MTWSAVTSFDEVAALLAERNRLDAALARAVRAAELTRPPPGARGERASRGEEVVLAHTEVHHGYRVERQPTRRWRTWRPDGTEITTPTALAPAA